MRLLLAALLSMSPALMAHNHNSAVLEIVVDKNRILAKLLAPGMDLVGFEGTPKTKEQKENLEKVTQTLNTDYNMLSFEPDGHCVSKSRKLSKPITKKSHTDFSYETSYECTDISSLKKIDLNLFRDIESFKEVTVKIVNGSEQKELKLGSTHSTFQL